MARAGVVSSGVGWRLMPCSAATKAAALQGKQLARATRLELATSGVTGRRSNQLSYAR